MKKLTLLGLLSLTTCSFLFAEEYITNEYFEEISSQPEIIYGISEATTILETDEILPLVEVFIENKSEVVNNDLQSEVQNIPTIELSPFEEALKQAKDERKVIMLSIRTTDCKYCDEMERTTLSDSSIKDALAANFVTVHYNQDLEPLPLGLEEGMTPIFIFVNTNEDILNMYPGIRNPDEFKEVLEQILAM